MIPHTSEVTSQICEHYLKTAFENKPATETFVRHPTSNKFAIIVEPRFDEITEHVIYNFMHFLNPLGWNLLIIGFSGHHDILEKKYPYALIYDIGDRHIFLDASNNPNINIESYNMIFMDPELWKNIPAKTALIFQRDCIMFREFPEHFLLYDYAGSNFLVNLAPLYGGINGGFSIRKPAVMLECLERITWEKIDEYRASRPYSNCKDIPITRRNEDVFFTHACEMLCKIVPDVYSRTFLCIENGFNPLAAVHHGWNKGYISVESLIFLLQSSPFFSSIRLPEPVKICFITAVYGNYELSCKPFAKQTATTDFICFTDNPNITANGWKIDTTPYHIQCKNKLDDGTLTNSLQNNPHTFNVAKYYKQSFHLIPALKQYDAVVWIDGTVEITSERASEYILSKIYEHKIVGWHHELRQGLLKEEVEISNHYTKYNSTFWNGQTQPLQDVNLQYDAYVADGYSETVFKQMQPENPHFGVWLTCFVAFLIKDPNVIKFLDLWYQQTLKYTVQDQIGFPYVCQKTNLTPYTLPNKEVGGEFPHQNTEFYVKHDHGK